VYVHASECIQSNSIVVRGRTGVVLVDPGLTDGELMTISDDLRELGQPVIAGFSTHPHWDHVLWHTSFGDVPRYGTGRCAASLRDLLSQEDWEAQVSEGLPPQIAGEVPMDLLGLVTGLPAGATQIPWDGPELQIIEHRAHAPGHAALWIAERGVLIAGDMLSDVLIPMLDLHGSADPIGDYLSALQLFEDVADRVGVVVPGHGSVGGADDVRVRIDRDRAYVLALRDGKDVSDPRIGPSAKPGWEWVSGVHDWQAQSVAQRTA
jgi:glyoxylase-like metal-dependent hydrolase (beta-lactamase superfamily II)